MLALRTKLVRSFGPWALAGALFLVVGGHWGVLQTVAWAKMAWTYAQAEGSLGSCLEKTFDGAHPCAMCKSIKVAKEKEDTVPAVVSSAKKIEVFPSPLRVALPPRACRDFVFPLPSDMTAESRPNTPPDPVPIA